MACGRRIETRGKPHPLFLFCTSYTHKWFKEDIKREVEMGNKYNSSHKGIGLRYILLLIGNERSVMMAHMNWQRGLML